MSFLPSCHRFSSVCMTRRPCSTSLRCTVSLRRRSGVPVFAVGERGTALLSVMPSVKSPRRWAPTSLGLNHKEVHSFRSTIKAFFFVQVICRRHCCWILLCRRLHTCPRLQQGVCSISGGLSIPMFGVVIGAGENLSIGNAMAFVVSNP